MNSSRAQTLHGVRARGEAHLRAFRVAQKQVRPARQGQHNRVRGIRRALPREPVKPRQRG